jgi:2-polyprenyl-6-methoxyphenol hydroxylase-like FAD-dependent oxidoreductase
MAVPIDKEGTQAAWGITAETEQRDREGWREYEYSGQAARDGKALFKDVKTEPLRSVLDNAEESEARIWPHHTIGDVPSWHRGRICLLGDAAHALPPNGQGSALAFEDAAFLSRLLSSPSAVEMGYDRLFSHYESVRRERVRNIQRSAKSAGTVKKKTGPWVWYTKKWAFWAFFTWKGGELRMGHDKSYDVMKESINIQES